MSAVPQRHQSLQPLRRAWTAAGALLLAAGLAGLLATHLHWTGCAAGSATAVCFDPEGQTSSFPPLAAGDPRLAQLLGGLCALTVVVAWLLVVVAARLRRTLTVCAVLAVLQPALTAALALMGGTLAGPTDALLGTPWLYVVSGVAALGFVGLVVMEAEATSGADRLRWVVLTGAVTVFGPVAGLGENLLLAFLHPEVADAVPGAGYVLAGLLLAVGFSLLTASVVTTVRRQRTTAPPTNFSRILVRV